MIPALSATFQKYFFLVTGRIRIADPIRGFVYNWAWKRLRGQPCGASLLDIGARNSRFAAFCAWRGFHVTAIDTDTRFLAWQNEAKREWRVDYATIVTDVTDLDPALRFESVLALFSLQHAGDRDIAGYEKAFALLKPGGQLLIVNEYNPQRTTVQTGRDDGTLRIYGPDDLSDRIEKPLLSLGGRIIDKRFAAADIAKGSIRWEDDPEKRAIVFLVIGKPLHE
jgi:SAM-dependent methyltransferase